MNTCLSTPSSWTTFPEDAAQAAAQLSAQVTAEKARRRANRPWFKKKRLSVPLTLIVGFVIILAVVNGSGDPTTVTSPPKAPAVAAGIGTTVRDGTLEFVVTGVERPGKTLEGKVGMTLTALGEFVVVRVDVTNVGEKAQRLSCECQFLSDDKGQGFPTSPSILSTKDALKYVEWINPGTTVKDASVLFDVAPGTKAVNITLHDSPWSPGVKVKLS